MTLGRARCAAHHRCTRCGIGLPHGVKQAECAVCRLLEQFSDTDCHCQEPLPSRLYLGRWMCYYCSALIPVAAPE